MNVKRPAISPRIFWLASLLFLVSGGTGLVYQVVWFKRFSHVWGSTSLAFAAVGGSFLFGLGLGAYLIGRYADRMTFPLRWYGLCELAIGSAALVIPMEIAALADASAGLYARIPEEPLLRFLVQFCITLVVIGPPCMLMGGTLPLLIRQLTTRDGALDQATGWLYSINTFGAAFGCYLTGFHFLPSFGLLWTNNAAATVNLAIGAVSLLASGSAELRAPRRTAPAAEVADRGEHSWRLWSLYVASALTGCGALVLEMTWGRQLALVLGGSTYAFTATLFVMLLGIASGSLIYHVWMRRVESSAGMAAAVIGILVVATLLGKMALPQLSLWVAPKEVRELRGDQLWNGAISVGASALVELLPAVAMGLLFPLFVRLTKASAAHVGSAVGNIYACNTLGSIAGASLTAVLLFPRMGTAGAMALAVALYIAAMFAVLPWRTAADFAWGAGATVVGIAVVALVARPIDPRLTNLGYYIYGDPVVTYGGEDWLPKIETTFFREGASSNVLVTLGSESKLSLRVNGKVDASNGADMVTQLGMAYLPRIFKHDARDVMVIGFGSGCTPGTSLLFDETRVTCCEIEPAVYEASEQFAPYNHKPQEKTRAWLEARNAELPPGKRQSASEIDAQARFSITFGDGRTAMQGSRHKYDLIISEPSNPWLAGVSNLFTREFFRSVREHLSDDGVLAQWIQTYQFTLDDYLMIVRTLRTEFPHVSVLLFSRGLDTAIVASGRPLLPRREDLDTLQKTVDATPEIAADLKQWFGGTSVRQLLLRHYCVGEDQLSALVERDRSRAINTDLNLRLEFDAPLYLFRTLPPRESATMALLSAVETRWIEKLALAIGVPPDSAELHVALGEHLVQRISDLIVANPTVKQAEWSKAAAEFEAALEREPKLADAHRGLGRVRALQNRHAEAAAAFGQLVRVMPDDALAHAEWGLELFKLKKHAQAVDSLREALRLRPEISLKAGNVTWANNLAWLLATSPDASLRNGPEAVDWAQKACASQGYKNASLLDTLAAAMAEAGRFDEAIKTSEEQIAAARADSKMVETAKRRIKLYRSSQAYREE